VYDRYTLSTRPESIAAMLCAFFPKFPTHSNDNRLIVIIASDTNYSMRVQKPHAYTFGFLDL